jgi:clan AA aspartic protease
LRAVFRGSDCRPYRGGYVLSLSLVNPVNGGRGEVEAAIDTGFDGFLMLESATYSALGLELCEVPESQFPAYQTLSGTIVFRSSSARAIVSGRELPVEVISPSHGEGKNLVGRRVLGQFTTLLDKTQTCCVGAASVES